MTATHTRRLRTLTAALALACLGLAPTPARAELRTRRALLPRAVPAPALTNLPKLLVVKGSPTSPVAAETLVPTTPKPLALTAKFKQALLLQSGQPTDQPAPPVELSASRPCIPGFARLHLCNPRTVSCGTPACPEGFASFPSHPGFPSVSLNDHSASVIITPTAPGKRYLVDFQVSGGSTYALSTGTGAKQTFSGTGHLVVLFEAAGTYPCALTVAGVTAAPTGLWYFRGCEITPLN